MHNSQYARLRNTSKSNCSFVEMDDLQLDMDGLNEISSNDPFDCLNSNRTIVDRQRYSDLDEIMQEFGDSFVINCETPKFRKSNSVRVAGTRSVSSNLSFASGSSNATVTIPKNYTFTNAQLRGIERDNRHLLKKIVISKAEVENKLADVQFRSAHKLSTAAARIRHKQQLKIDAGNELMELKLRKIATRRSSTCF